MVEIKTTKTFADSWELPISEKPWRVVWLGDHNGVMCVNPNHKPRIYRGGEEVVLEVFDD